MAFIWGQFRKRYTSHHSRKISVKITYLKLNWNLPGANELSCHPTITDCCGLSEIYANEISTTVRNIRQWNKYQCAVDSALWHKWPCLFRAFIHEAARRVTDRSCSTHWGPDKMVAMFQMVFSNAFSRMKMFEFQMQFDWGLFPRVQLIIIQHWLR